MDYLYNSSDGTLQLRRNVADALQVVLSGVNRFEIVYYDSLDGSASADEVAAPAAYEAKIQKVHFVIELNSQSLKDRAQTTVLSVERDVYPRNWMY